MPENEIYRVTTVVEVDQSQLNVGLARAEQTIKAFQQRVARTRVLGGASMAGRGAGGGGGGGGGGRAAVPSNAEIADVIAAGTGLSGKAVTAAGRGARSIAAVMRADQARIRTAIVDERLAGVKQRNAASETTRIASQTRISVRHDTAMARAQASELRARDTAARAAEKHNIFLDASQRREQRESQNLVTGAIRQRLALRQLNGQGRGAGGVLGNVAQQATNRPTTILGGILSPLATIGLAAQGIGMIGRAVGAVTNAAAAPVRAASDLNETINMAQVIMGRTGAASTMAFAQGNVLNLGMSQEEALRSTALYANTLRHGGMNQAQANQRATETTQMVADIASLFNRAPEQVATDVQAALTGRFRPLRKYGIVINEEDVRREAEREGLSTGGGALTQGQRNTATNTLLMKQAKFAAGDYAKTNKQLANELRNITALWKNFNAVIGQSALTASAGFLQGPVNLLKAINDNLTSTTHDPAFQNLDLFGRAGLMWQNLTSSFDRWWNSNGKSDVAQRAERMGKAFGTGLADFINGIAGLSTGKGDNVWASAGKTAGSSFFKGFRDGFNLGNVAGTVGTAWYQNMVPNAMHPTDASARGGLPAGQASIGSFLGVGLLSVATISGLVKFALGLSKITGVTAAVKGVAGLMGRRAAGQVAGEAAGVAAEGALGVELLSGPAGWAVAIGSLLLPFAMSYIASNPSALSNLGHPHDLCDCIQNAFSNLLPFLGGARPAAGATRAPVATPAGVAVPGVAGPEAQDPYATSRPDINGRAVSPAAEAAVQKALSQTGNMKMSVGGMLESVVNACERYVENLFGAAGQPHAGTAWQKAQDFISKGMFNKITNIAEAPRGSLVYFDQNTPNSGGAGHVGISTGGGGFVSALGSGVTDLEPGNSQLDFWNKWVRGYAIPNYGTAAGAAMGGAASTLPVVGPLINAVTQGRGAGGPDASGITVTLANGAVQVNLSIDSLDDAGVARLASALGGPVAQAIADGVGQRLSNMTREP
jgi:hypothetical protein